MFNSHSTGGFQSQPAGSLGLAAWRKDRGLAKHELRRAVYDFPEVTKSREALQAQVLQGKKFSPTSLAKAKDDPGDEPGDVIKEWLTAERKAADVEARKKWKENFAAWHKRSFPSLQDRAFLMQQSSDSEAEMPISPASPTSEVSAVWAGLDPDDPTADAIVKQTQAYKENTQELKSKEVQLKRDIGRLKDELEVERQRRANLDKLLKDTTEDRSAWEASANRHEIMRTRLQEEQRITMSKVLEVESKLLSISNALQVREAGLPPSSEQ